MVKILNLLSESLRVSSWLPHPANAFFLMKAIIVSVFGISALLAFILIRRATRRVHFHRHDALAFQVRKQWPEILSGKVQAKSWRDDPMQREIVQANVLRELEVGNPEDRPRLQQFLRANGLLDACIDLARTGRGWQQRQALVTLGAMLMPEAIPALTHALHDRHLETRLAAVRALGNMEALQAAEPILDHLLGAGLDIPDHPVANALIRCCRKHPAALLPYLRRAQGKSRELLARVAGEIASPELADEMLFLTEDPLPEVRASAARALATAPLPIAIPALSDLARDEIWFVRLRAIVSLDQIRHPRIIPALLYALCDSNRLIRLRSASALSQFVDDRTKILENVVDLHDRYALHAMISALELAGDFGKVVKALSDPLRHDAAARQLLDALREGAAGLWDIGPKEPVLREV